ncbi:MAG: phosphatase PAP2 family protein [Patescibacteria group bacterium]
MNNIVITFLASFLIWILFLGLFVFWVIDGKIKKEQAVHGFFAFNIAWILADILKNFFPSVRPFLANGNPALVLSPGENGAFPSGHTAAAFALAVTIFMHNRKVGIFYIIAAILIGFARVAANVHYPIDILGGALLGTLIAVLIEKVHFPLTISRR